MYYTITGDEITLDQIREAFAADKALLVHGYKIDGGISTGLSLDGEERDTRGECYSAWDEVWTERPRGIAQLVAAARA